MKTFSPYAAIRSLAVATLAVATLAVAVPAQEYRQEQNDDIGVKYQVFAKLSRLPLKIGETDAHLKARFEPSGAGDYIHGRHGAFAWYLTVYAFPKAPLGKDGTDASAPITGGGEKGDGDKEGPPSKEDVEARMREEMGKSRRTSQNFAQWVAEHDKGAMSRKFVVKGKTLKATSKRPEGTWWEYTDTNPMSNGYERIEQLWYSCAAVYDLPDMEVALIAAVPVKKGVKPDQKHMTWMRRMCESLEPLKEKDLVDVGEDSAKDKFADTPERKAELEKAKANVVNLAHWDYFTTPHYIVLYSWPPKKAKISSERNDALRKAKQISSQMEEMYKMYEEYYPPHDKMEDIYSVLRICQDYDEFRQYGDSPSGAVGWYSPMTKELVFFTGGEAFAGKGFTTAVAFHEGWHQYSDRYFDFPLGKELHRWFDEGTGDWFGSHSWSGRTFSYETSRMRRMDIKQIVREKKWVPIKEIITWNKDKFYGAGAADFYAQGYAIIDFLRNGSGRAIGWDKSWASILETYRKVNLEEKDPAKAVTTAFEGVDFEKFEESWIKWVQAY